MRFHVRLSPEIHNQRLLAKIFLAAAEIIKHPKLSHNEIANRTQTSNSNIANQALAQRRTPKNANDMKSAKRGLFNNSPKKRES